MSNSTRNLICLGLIAIGIFAAYLFLPAKNFSPKGIVLSPVANQTPFPDPQQVAIYNHQPATSYRNLGIVTVTLAYNKQASSNRLAQDQQRIVDYARKLAAQAGGNGIITYGAMAEPGPANSISMRLTGEVIYSQ
jgi:hypothetical protein